MRARAVMLVLAAVVGTATAGEPKPKPVDIKPFRAKLVVLEDPAGGTYLVLPAGSESRVWFGSGKTLYEQVNMAYSANGAAWDVSLWAPRVANMQPGSLQKKADGSYHRWCGADSDMLLKLVTADRAKVVLDRFTVMSPAALRVPYLLARDDAGTYYYIDKIREAAGGGGYRVFVGKKGAMTQLPLSDVATDLVGDVFATKSGNVRFVHDAAGDKHTATWVHGATQTQLALIDTYVSSRLIFKDLGIYQFLGTLCDDI